MVSDYITRKDDLGQTITYLREDLENSQVTNNILQIQIETSHNSLRSVQEGLCLATVDRLKLKDKQRQTEKQLVEVRGTGHPRRSDLSPLQLEVDRLKTDIETFEKSQENLLLEIRTLNEQLNMAENTLVNVEHFKNIIQNNLILYKERNTALESQLRSIYNDLIVMENHFDKKAVTKKQAIANRHSAEISSKGAKLLLETLDLHQHFQSLEDDLLETKSQHRNLKEEAADLLERCTTLEEEKEIHRVSSSFIGGSNNDQSQIVKQLQQDKEKLIYEKERMQLKLKWFQGEQRRIMEDCQKLNKALLKSSGHNRELQKKLRHYEVDYSGVLLKNNQKHSDDNNNCVNLCKPCQTSIKHRFLGISNSTQLLGDELLDCIEDNFTLEAAIFSFMERNTILEEELVAVETTYRDFEKSMLCMRSLNVILPHLD